MEEEVRTHPEARERMVTKSHIGVENMGSLQAVDAGTHFHISEFGGLPACAHVFYLCR